MPESCIFGPLAAAVISVKAYLGTNAKTGGHIDVTKGQDPFITGGSRGIGLAIALKAAADGANVAIAAKTVDPHPKLEGTIHTAAAEIEKAGGQRWRSPSTCARKPR